MTSSKNSHSPESLFLRQPCRYLLSLRFQNSTAALQQQQQQQQQRVAVRSPTRKRTTSAFQCMGNSETVVTMPVRKKEEERKKQRHQVVTILHCGTVRYVLPQWRCQLRQGISGCRGSLCTRSHEAARRHSFRFDEDWRAQQSQSQIPGTKLARTVSPTIPYVWHFKPKP